MKWKSFLAGVLTTLLIMALAIPALAVSDFPSSIDIAPINILVNGEVFRPKDVNGNNVLVFVSNGTTYAPVRALAEAYGLKVDYDHEKNLATVTDPDVQPTTTPDPSLLPDYSDWTAEEEAAYQEFRGMWDIKPREVEGIKYDNLYIAWYNRDGTSSEVLEILVSYGEETLDKFTFRMMNGVLMGNDGNLALWHKGPGSLFGVQSTNGEQTKVADSIFHQGMLD